MASLEISITETTSNSSWWNRMICVLLRQQAALCISQLPGKKNHKWAGSPTGTCKLRCFQANSLFWKEDARFTKELLPKQIK